MKSDVKKLRAWKGCKSLEFIILNEKNKYNGSTKHIVSGSVVSNFSGLVICEENSGVFLYYCNKDWEVITDTWHKSVADAKEQASLEYSGITENDWQTIP